MRNIVWNYSALPFEGVQTANYRLWVEDPKDIKGLIILMPGINGDARDMVFNEKWRSLAREIGYALLGVQFVDSVTGSCSYCCVDMGSGESLDNAIHQFQKQGGIEIPENYLLWGHSAGGQFNFNYACFAPDKVKAFIVNKGCCYYSRPCTRKIRQIPAIFFIGEHDEARRKNSIEKLYHKGKAKGAIWILHEEKGVGHEVGGSEDISIEFFRKRAKEL